MINSSSSFIGKWCLLKTQNIHTLVYFYHFIFWLWGFFFFNWKQFEFIAIKVTLFFLNFWDSTLYSHLWNTKMKKLFSSESSIFFSFFFCYFHPQNFKGIVAIVLKIVSKKLRINVWSVLYITGKIWCRLFIDYLTFLYSKDG